MWGGRAEETQQLGGIMSIQVSTFNDKELKAAIKQSPKIVQEYIEAQKRALEGYKQTLGGAMNKIFELSKQLTEKKGA